MLLRDVRLIGGTGELIEGVDLRVRDGRWVEIARGLSPGDDEAVDLGGATAMPGLIDAHTHLTLDASARGIEGELRLAGAHALAYQAVLTERRAEALLAQGVTTARDVGGTAPVILAVRDAIARGHARGPRIFAAGHWITVTGGHGWTVGVEADGPDALRRAVRDEIKAGVDMIKLMVSGGVVGPGLGPQSVQFSEDEVRVAAEIAHGNAMPIAAHAHGTQAIHSAVHGGVDTVEHGSYLTEELAHEMLRRGTFLVVLTTEIGDTTE
jgi:imidazolonepropionase-like amidohydrolase